MTTDWGYPEELWQSYCWDSNGYAGSASHIHQDGIKVIKSKKSTRVLTQQITQQCLLTDRLNSIMVQVPGQAAGL
jgi:hypothetical protein